jgi:tetratricopeptide (TPR) repeat protein
MSPGKRKSSGETLREALIPPQPVTASAVVSNRIALLTRFEFRLTGGTIGLVMALATGISGSRLVMRNSTVAPRKSSVDSRRRPSFTFVIQAKLTVQWLLFTAAIVVSIQSSSLRAADFAQRAELAFKEAQHQVETARSNVTFLLAASAAAFNHAEFARTKEQRAAVANHGIDAAREAIHLSPTNAAAHYWLGMNFGQLARTKTLGALHLVREMEQKFLRARELDPHVDFAGPDRSLGLLYRDAPGWPASIGHKGKAREHLNHAVRLHPEFPDNQLALAETLWAWGEHSTFSNRLTEVQSVMEKARAQFTGAEWETSWADWTNRLVTLQRKLQR